MRRSLALVLTGLLLVAPAALAQDFAIRLEKPWVRRAPLMPDARPGAESTAAGYVTLVNRGSERDVRAPTRRRAWSCTRRATCRG